MHNERHSRYERLRAAGFTPAEAQKLRDSEARTIAAIREVQAGRSPRATTEKFADRPIQEVREYNVVTNPTVKRLKNDDEESKHVSWSRWSSSGFPRSILRVAEAFRGALLRQGHSQSDVDQKLFGLVYQWYFGEFDYDDLISDTDIFDEY